MLKLLEIIIILQNIQNVLTVLSSYLWIILLHQNVIHKCIILFIGVINLFFQFQNVFLTLNGLNELYAFMN